jgi:hypothetical protein
MTRACVSAMTGAVIFVKFRGAFGFCCAEAALKGCATPAASARPAATVTPAASAPLTTDTRAERVAQAFRLRVKVRRTTRALAVVKPAVDFIARLPPR